MKCEIYLTQTEAKEMLKTAKDENTRKELERILDEFSQEFRYIPINNRLPVPLATSSTPD